MQRAAARRAEAAKEVGDEHGAGEGVVGVAVVSHAEDVRTRVFPVLVGHVGDHAAEIGQACEHVHVKGKAGLFMIPREKFRLNAENREKSIESVLKQFNRNH